MLSSYAVAILTFYLGNQNGRLTDARDAEHGEDLA
jgi:hypothetical protein